MQIMRCLPCAEDGTVSYGTPIPIPGAVSIGLDANKVLIENANVELGNFALLFEFDGDVKKIRHCMYKCAASHPRIESQTNEDEIEVKTETLSLKATPLANGVVKSQTGDDTSDATCQNWYKAVYMPATEPEAKAAVSTTGK